jgi:hypothetical protein
MPPKLTPIKYKKLRLTKFAPKKTSNADQIQSPLLYTLAVNTIPNNKNNNNNKNSKINKAPVKLKTIDIKLKKRINIIAIIMIYMLLLFSPILKIE